MEVLARITQEHIVPVIKLDDPKSSVPLADALTQGGIHVAEITFRTSAAAEAIALLRKDRPDLLVGAGTVITVQQLDAAVEAGAQFVVAPGFNPVIVQAAQERGVIIIPGVNNPSLVEMAMQLGLRVLKFFPAELSGGVPMLKPLASVYPVSFMPTGGLDEANILDYLRLSNVVACGGSWMVKPEYIRSGRFETIRDVSAAITQKIAREL